MPGLPIVFAVRDGLEPNIFLHPHDAADRLLLDAAQLGCRDLAALGIPSRSAEVETYRMRTGLDPGPHLATYLAYNFFRVAAILQGIAGRVRDGTATSENAAGMAAMVRPLAAKAWQFAQETAA